MSSQHELSRAPSQACRALSGVDICATVDSVDGLLPTSSTSRSLGLVLHRHLKGHCSSIKGW